MVVLLTLFCVNTDVRQFFRSLVPSFFQDFRLKPQGVWGIGFRV